jgi:hypothetical protein
MIFLAVPFPAHKDVAKQFKNWNGKIVVDVMNTLDLSPKEREELGGVLSSEVVAKAFIGARVALLRTSPPHPPGEPNATSQHSTEPSDSRAAPPV